jgi:AraC-like DNA-binding protein
MKENEIVVKDVKIGEVTVVYKKKKYQETEIAKILKPVGLVVVSGREEKIVEDAKRCVIELIHELNNANSLVRKSEYLVEKMGMSYQQISKIFSKYEPITLERYSILVKIEKVKEMIWSDEFSLSEIAYMMDYSSVQYLSNQFKKETGYSVTEYKKQGLNLRKSIDELY